MKILFINIGLALLALFCFEISFSQTNSLESKRRDIKALRKSFSDGKTYYLNHIDTSKLVQIQRIDDFESKSTFYFAEVDSNHLGVLNEDLEWVIEPNYCAINDFDPERSLASVRACPFEFSFNGMNYWDEWPTYGNWGIADTSGNWLIEPHYHTPIFVDQKTQLVQNDRELKDILIFNLKEQWLGEHDMIAQLGNEIFVLKKGYDIGVRKVDGSWILPFAKRRFYITSSDVVLVDSNIADGIYQMSLIRITKNGDKERLWKYEDYIKELTTVTRFLYLAGEEVQVFNENISNSNNMLSDSTFTQWFITTYWRDLYGAPREHLTNYSGEDLILDVFADTIYTSPPRVYYPYDRIDAFNIWFDIEKSEMATYSILKNGYHVNHGSRGPAYENSYYKMKSLQIVKGRVMELELGDCFKKRDSSILEKYINKQMPDSASFYWDDIEQGLAFWQLAEDSLFLYFPRFARPIGYSEYDFDYKKVVVLKKEFGRKFLKERRRKRQLLRD